MNHQADAQLDRWLIDQDLTDDEVGGLHDLLEGPGGAALRERLVLACLLGQALDPTSPDAFAAGVAERLRAVDAEAFASRVRARLRPAVRWRWAVAACLMIAAAAGLCWHAATSRPDVCRLVDGAGTVTVGRGDARLIMADGAVLRPDDSLMAAAPAAVAWEDGTRISLAAGTGVILGQGRRLRLSAGTVDASVAPQAPGSELAIATPDAVATVVGTRFTLSWDGRRTRLQVDDGTVRLAASGREIIVPMGGLAETELADGLAAWRRMGPDSWHAETGAWTWSTAGTVSGDGAAERARLVAREGAGDLDLACRFRIGGSVNRAEIQCAGYAWYATVLRKEAWRELRLRRRGRDVSCTVDEEPVGIAIGDAAADPAGPPAFYVAGGGVLEIAELRMRSP